MASAPVPPSSSVWPSGSAVARALTPIVWPAPGRLSTTTVWPSRADSCSATIRATTSGELPAADATISLTGLLGYAAAGSFAAADPAQPSTETRAAARNMDSVGCGVILSVSAVMSWYRGIMPVCRRKESSHLLYLHNFFSRWCLHDHDRSSCSSAQAAGFTFARCRRAVEEHGESCITAQSHPAGGIEGDF